MNTKEIKKMIYSFLKTVTNNVYNEQAPAKVAYPYVIYNLELSDTMPDQKFEVHDLVIEIYGNDQFDSTSIDLIASNIDGDGAITNATGLHRKHYYVANTLQCDIYRESRDKIYESDGNIRVLELTYNVNAYLY